MEASTGDMCAVGEGLRGKVGSGFTGTSWKVTSSQTVHELGGRDRNPIPRAVSEWDPLSGLLHTERKTIISLKGQGGVGAPPNLTQA